MSSTQGSPPPRYELEYTPTPLDGQPTGVTIDGVWFADERVVMMTEQLALYNATRNMDHVANLAAMCADILSQQPAQVVPADAEPLEAARVQTDDQRHDQIVRRRKKQIARIFNGSYATSLEDCKCAIDAFKDLWGNPSVPIKPLALYRLVKHLQMARRRGLHIRYRYRREFLGAIFEKEADGIFITWDAPDDTVMRALKMTYRDVKGRVDRPGDD